MWDWHSTVTFHTSKLIIIWVLPCFKSGWNCRNAILHLHRPSVILHRIYHTKELYISFLNHHNIVINLPKLVSLIIRNLKHQDDFPIRHVGQNNSCLKSNTFYFFGWRKIGCKKIWKKNKVSELHRPTYSVWLLVCRYNYTPTTYVGVLYWRDSVLEATAFIFIIICWRRTVVGYFYTQSSEENAHTLYVQERCLIVSSVTIKHQLK